jgi:isopenicillin-N N-acyltransferase-like protein
MKVLTLEGTAFERGVAYGSECAEIIARRAEGWNDPLTHFPKWPKQRVEQVAGNILFYMMDHTPEIIEEMRGIAKGAGRSFSEVFFINCRYAMGHVLRGRGQPSSCSNFVADTADCGPMLGKTADNGYYPGITVDKEFLIQRVKPSRGLRWVGAVRPGELLTEAGINEAGLAVGQSSGPSGLYQEGHGVSYPHIIRHLLQFCSSADEALDFLLNTAIAGKGVVFMLADARGAFHCVEAWSDRRGVREPENGALYCANLFVHPDMQFLPPRHDLAHSKARMRNFAQLYAEQAKKGPYTEAFMEKVLTYHADEGSICRHGKDDPADFGGYSFGFLFYCRDRVMKFSPGQPCQEEFLRFTFDF